MAVIVKRVGYVPAAVSSGGTSTAARYLVPFTSGTWVLSGTDYVITVNAGTHNKGTSPTVSAYLDTGSTYEEVVVATTIDTSGNVTIYVTATPDNRFSGKLLIL